MRLIFALIAATLASACTQSLPGVPQASDAKPLTSEVKDVAAQNEALKMSQTEYACQIGREAWGLPHPQMPSKIMKELRHGLGDKQARTMIEPSRKSSAAYLCTCGTAEEKKLHCAPPSSAPS